MEAGLSPGEIVLIFASTGIQTYFAFFGAQLAAGVPSIMPPPTVKQDIIHYRKSHQELIRRIEPKLVCGPYDVLAGLAAEGSEARQLALEELPDGTTVSVGTGVINPADLPVYAREDLVLLQHSSGTTGLKKGVALSYGAIEAQVAHYAAALGLGARDKVFSWLPLYHDMGLIACTVMPFVTATPLVAMDPFVWLSDPLLMIRAVQEQRCTLAWLPNFAFEHLANAGRRQRRARADMSSLRMLINCSEVCRTESMDRFQNTFAADGLQDTALHTCYALAENVFAAAQSLPSEGPARLVVDAFAIDRNEVLPLDPAAEANCGGRELISSGRPIDGCVVMIRTSEGRTAHECTVGELLLRTDCMFQGYYGNSVLSQERLVEGWYETRDLGFIHNGHIYVLGRLDDVIIYRGRNLFAADLEAAFVNVPGLKPGRTVVFGVYSETVGSEQVVVLFETVDKGRCEDLLEEAERAVRSRLQDQFGINPIQVIPMAPNSLRKTTSGKISRSANREEFLRRLQSGEMTS